jgi:uncharacterized protein (TIGR00251 family)
MSGTRTVLRLRVVPGAARARVVGRYGAAWKVRVTAPPEAGRANEAVLDLLARTLELPRRNLAIEAGAASRDKIVSLVGMSADAAEARLEAAGSGAR